MKTFRQFLEVFELGVETQEDTLAFKVVASRLSDAMQKHNALSTVAHQLTSGRVRLSDAVATCGVYPENVNVKTKAGVLKAAAAAKEEYLAAQAEMERAEEWARSIRKR